MNREKEKKEKKEEDLEEEKEEEEKLGRQEEKLQRKQEKLGKQHKGVILAKLAGLVVSALVQPPQVTEKQLGLQSSLKQRDLLNNLLFTLYCMYCTKIPRMVTSLICAHSLGCDRPGF